MEAPRHSRGDLLIEALEGGVARVVINRPQSLNAISRQLREDLVQVFGELDRDPQVSAIVLTGAGGRAFAAGQDLSEALSFDGSSAAEWIDEWRALYDCVLSLSKPTVAAVDGYAVGAGFQLALVCDLRLASERARFGMPEIDDGIPCITGTWTLYELIGRGRTTDLVLSGRMIDAAEALQWGVVSQVVPAERLAGAAAALAARLGAKPAAAMRLNKRWLRDLLLSHLPAAEEYAKRAHGEAFGSGEPQRLMADFLAKRAAGRST